MPIKEKATEQIIIKANEPAASMSGVTVNSGTIIDTEGYDNGLYFAMDPSLVASGDTLEMKLYHGDNALLSDIALVPDDNLVYGEDALVSAAIAEGSTIIKEGVFGTKRYVMAEIDKTGAGVSMATIYAIANPEIAKTEQGGP